MTIAVLPKFDSIQDGVDYMSTFLYPCAFQVDTNTYDYLGNALEISYDIIEIRLNRMYMIQTYGSEDTTEGVLYVESGICKCNKIG